MSDWTDFAKRCADNVRKIQETTDEGVYAKLYAADVQVLLRMIEKAVECYPEGIVPEVVFAWLTDGTTK